VKELDVPRNPKGGGGGSNPGAASDTGGSEEGGLEPLEDLPGVGARTRLHPAGGQGRGELGALSDPLRNTRETRKVSVEAVKGERNWNVIGERGADSRVGTVVGGVGKDGDVSSNEWAGEEGRGHKKTIEPRST